MFDIMKGEQEAGPGKDLNRKDYNVWNAGTLLCVCRYNVIAMLLRNAWHIMGCRVVKIGKVYQEGTYGLNEYKDLSYSVSCSVLFIPPAEPAGSYIIIAYLFNTALNTSNSIK